MRPTTITSWLKSGSSLVRGHLPEAVTSRIAGLRPTGSVPSDQASNAFEGPTTDLEDRLDRLGDALGDLAESVRRLKA